MSLRLCGRFHLSAICVKKTVPHSDSARFARMSDIELYQMSAQAGSGEAAFRELYARLSGKVHAYCRCVAWKHEESEDLFQEAFVRLYESALQGREVVNVSGYVIKIARNLWLNMKRDRKATVDIETANIAMPELPHERSEMLELIHMAMNFLSDEHREAFFLREFADMPYEEIAEATNTSPGNVRIRVTRARERIRSILQPYINEFDTMHTRKNS